MLKSTAYMVTNYVSLEKRERRLEWWQPAKKSTTSFKSSAGLIFRSHHLKDAGRLPFDEVRNNGLFAWKKNVEGKDSISELILQAYDLPINIATLTHWVSTTDFLKEGILNFWKFYTALIKRLVLSRKGCSPHVAIPDMLFLQRGQWQN